MFTAITAVISALAAPISTWLNRRAELKAAEHATALAIQENKTRLALSESEYNHQWEMAQLQNSSKVLKYASFSLFAGPVLLAMLAPWLKVDLTPMWVSLESVPEYWRAGFTGITGAIWGIAQLKDMGGVKGVLGWAVKTGVKTSVSASTPPPTHENPVSGPVSPQPGESPMEAASSQEKASSSQERASKASTVNSRLRRALAGILKD